MSRIFAALILFTLLSCSSEVEIFYPSNYVKENTVIINDDINLKDRVGSESYSSVMVSNGEVNVLINDVAKSFDTRRGGMLNLNSEEFVIFPVIYGSNAIAGTIMPHSVVIDSTIYFKDQRGFNEDFFLMHHVKDGSDPDVFKLTNAMSSIGSETFFQEKRWDININQEIPEEIREKQNKDIIGGPTGSRMVLRSGDVFKLYTMLTDEYKAIDMRSDSVKYVMARNLKGHLADIEARKAKAGK